MRKFTDEERAARKAKRNARMFSTAEKIVKDLPGVRIGYIGNVGPQILGGGYQFDDRAWFIFLPGEGARDIGSYPTEERGKLLFAAEMLKRGYELKR